MAEGNETSDVWGRTADIDESALSVMAERLESRAKHPFFRRVIAEYIGDLELERISSALEIGCGTGVVSRALAVAPGFRGTITATDVSPHLIDAGRRFAAMEGVEGRIAFEVSSAAACTPRIAPTTSSSPTRFSATRRIRSRSWRSADGYCVPADSF